MKKNGIQITAFILFLVTLSLACGSNPLAAVVGGNTVTVDVVYGSEKEEWLEPLVGEYNRATHKTESEATIQVRATPMGSIESMRGILSGEIEPTVWSPASSVYLPVGQKLWREQRAQRPGSESGGHCYVAADGRSIGLAG